MERRIERLRLTFSDGLVINSPHFYGFSIVFYTFAPRKEVYTMIIVNVKENESIEKALKRFKKKFDKTGAVRELRARQAFTKPSIVRRAQVIKAAYKQQLRDEEMK
jgi:small subunit ribosomal protein S21